MKTLCFWVLACGLLPACTSGGGEREAEGASAGAASTAPAGADAEGTAGEGTAGHSTAAAGTAGESTVGESTAGQGTTGQGAAGQGTATQGAGGSTGSPSANPAATVGAGGATDDADDAATDDAPPDDGSVGADDGASGAGGAMNPEDAAGGSGGDSGGAGGSSGSEQPVPVVPTGIPMVVVGGYDYSSDSYPLTTYDLDVESGALTPRGSSIDAGPNPSYLALSPTGTELYVANEVDSPSGGLTALSIAADGSLSVLNHQSGSDGGFTYVAVDPSGSFAFGASYNGGSISVFPIQADGSLGAELSARDFGDMAQSHCVGFDPTGSFVFVPNKGNDEVALLTLGSDGVLEDNSPASVETTSGAGPRHIAVHPDGHLAFVINELSSTLTPYRVSEGGVLSAAESVSTRAASGGQNTGAHVELSPDGRFVYGSNRGDDDIVVFSADQTTGALTLIEHEATRGRTPRDFEVDPAGRVLIAANQGDATLSVYSIAADGSLSPLGQLVNGPPEPAAVQIVYLP